MSKAAISRESIEKALSEHKPTSLSSLYKTITAKKTSVPGSVAAKMRMLVPDIMERLAENKKLSPTKSGSVAKSRKDKTLKQGDATATPYREGSAYSQIYQILMEHPDGISRTELIREAARRCKKSASRSGFDVAVVVSPRESCNGPRHRSARDGYYVNVQGSCYTLRTN